MRAGKWRAVFAVFIIALAGLAALWANARSYQWQAVQSADGHYRIIFPANPAASQLQMLNGSKFVFHRLSASPRRDVTYAVSWWENPSQQDKTTDELFAHFRECDITTFHGNIVSEHRVSVQGYSAQDTEISVGNGGLAVANRVVRVGPRMYSLWVIEPAGHRDAASVKRFFDSFSLF